MPKPIADDFDFIRARMAEIADAAGHNPWCRACEDRGWVRVEPPRRPGFDVCPMCFNPGDLPSP